MVCPGGAKAEAARAVGAERRPGDPGYAPVVCAADRLRRLRRPSLGQLVGHHSLPGLRRPLRLDLRLPLARSGARHGVQDRLDEQRPLRDRLVQVLRESTRWRWSHARHHSDTIIVGRDPEIAITRPPQWLTLLLRFFGINTTFGFLRSALRHCAGRFDPEEKSFVPESEHAKIVVRAYVYVLIYAAVIGLAIYWRSILPLMFIGLPAVYGSWLQFLYGHTQHAGLAENVLDHRLNTRTIYLGPINRYLYWEMNYHLEYHLFPLVPYHKLARLHELIRSDLPRPYGGLIEAWREIIATLLRQRKEPGYYIRRELPAETGNRRPMPDP